MNRRQRRAIKQSRVNLAETPDLSPAAVAEVEAKLGDLIVKAECGPIVAPTLDLETYAARKRAEILRKHVQVGTDQGQIDVQLNDRAEPVGFVMSDQLEDEPSAYTSEEASINPEPSGAATEAIPEDASETDSLEQPVLEKDEAAPAGQDGYGTTALRILAGYQPDATRIVSTFKFNKRNERDALPFEVASMIAMHEQLNELLINIGAPWHVPNNRSMTGLLVGILHQLHVVSALLEGTEKPEPLPAASYMAVDNEGRRVLVEDRAAEQDPLIFYRDLIGT
jgi:hypothetical protein